MPLMLSDVSDVLISAGFFRLFVLLHAFPSCLGESEVPGTDSQQRRHLARFLFRKRNFLNIAWYYVRIWRICLLGSLQL